MAAMMPSAGGGGSRSANPYEHYDNPSMEGDDLIDPDDGEPHSAVIAQILYKALTSIQPRLTTSTTQSTAPAPMTAFP